MPRREDYWAAKDAGICPNCKADVATTGRVYCAKCRKHQVALKQKRPSPLSLDRQRELRARRLAEGMCQYCGRIAVIPGLKYCEECQCGSSEWHKNGPRCRCGLRHKVCDLQIDRYAEQRSG